MKTLSKYNIQIQSLEEKTFEYEFEGNDAFFQSLEQNLIQKGSFLAKVKLEKSATMVQTRIEIAGEMELICDRSLENFNEPFAVNERHIFKFGEKAEELTDEIEVIPFGTPTINIAHLLFELIAVTIPMKKLHPRFRTEDEEDEKYIYSTDNEGVIEAESPKIDPRWAALSKLSSSN